VGRDRLSIEFDDVGAGPGAASVGPGVRLSDTPKGDVVVVAAAPVVVACVGGPALATPCAGAGPLPPRGAGVDGGGLNGRPAPAPLGTGRGRAFGAAR
jgi:hypothetical protein